MFKRMIFAEFLATVSVLPAFSAGFDRYATGEIEHACVAEHLGVTSGGTRLRAIWNPNVYTFVLDDKFYDSSTDTTGTEPTVPASYESLYSRYQDGIYGNSDGADQGDEDYKIEWLRIPEKTGYYFMGYYTDKYSGGTQLVGADGHISPEMQEIIVGSAPETLYAQWSPKTYTCNAGQYLNENGCETCPDGSWCPGVNGVVYDGEEHGRNSCAASGVYYDHSDNGRDEQADCYMEVSMPCATKNSYENGVASYQSQSGYAACKQYYGSESEDECVMIDETACDIKSVTCNEGYVFSPTESRCVPSKIKCMPGMYLPAGAYACELCPEDHYCLGDQPAVTVPQDTDVGIAPCSDAQTGGTKSPAGSKYAEDCGVIMHVDDTRLYLHADKVTSPSFVTEVNGKKWYADMTQVTNTCAKPISSDTTKTWHVDKDGDEYTVHGRYVECSNE